MTLQIRPAILADKPAIEALIAESVLQLQTEYREAQRVAALRTVFSVDSQLLRDGTYFVVSAEGVLAGCGGWSYRKTLYGGDHQVEAVDGERLEPGRDAAKIRAIFVRPEYARKGIGSLLLTAAEDAAYAAGYRRVEMGSTLTGVALYRLKGYREVERIDVPVGDTLAIEIVRMEKALVEDGAAE